MRVLFSLLGRPIENRDPQKASVYATAKYEFHGGDVIETALFGLALLEWQKRQDTPVDKIVILGTNGSSWRVILEALDLAVANLELWDKLGDLEAQVPPPEPQKLRPLLSMLSGVVSAALSTQVVCHIIDTLVTKESQRTLVDELVKHSSSGDDVFVDVTHALGHQRVLLAIASYVLAPLGGVNLKGVYSGVYELRDQTTQVAPVVELAGAVSNLKLLGTIERFAATGDVDGLQVSQPTRALKRAFSNVVSATRLNQPAAVTAAVHSLIAALENAGLTVAEARLIPLLGDFAAGWTGSPPAVMLSQAKLALARKDLLRASVLAREAELLFARATKGEDATETDLNAFLRQHVGAHAGELRVIRNAIVHCAPPTTDALKALFARGDDAVSTLLGDLITELEKMVG